MENYPLMEIFLLVLIVFIVFLITTRKKAKPKKKRKVENRNLSQDEKEFLKIKGDLYEKFIGQSFEEKGELVIYNGFIYGYADRGVDVISICVKRKTINLIQCKHWSYKQMFREDIEEIYRKLSQFELEQITQDIRAIKTHLKKKKNLAEIEAILAKDKAKFSVRKILYMSSAKVIDPTIGRKLKQIKPNIFQYRDMKIVIVEI